MNRSVVGTRRYYRSPRLLGAQGAAALVAPTVQSSPDADSSLVQVLGIAREETERRDHALRATNTALRQEIAERKRFEIELARTTRALTTLSAGNQALVHAADEPHLMQGAVDAAVTTGGYRMAWTGLLAVEAPGGLVPVAFSEDADTYLRQVVESHGEGASLLGLLACAREGRSAVVRDTLDNEAFSPWRHSSVDFGFRSVVALPLLFASGETLGVLVIYAAEVDAFDDYEMRILDELACDLAYGIESLRNKSLREAAEDGLRRSNEQLEHMVHDVTRAMGRIVETRDPYTQGHEVRVAGLSRQIARRMGLSNDDQEAVEMAGMVHDIGKLCVPAEILTKPGSLSAAEFSLIKQHAQQGFEILKDIAFPWPIAEIVLQHHERMDGSGYPDGLRGDDINRLARVLAVADVVEAMASDRPYRPALGIEVAIAEIRNDRSKFDLDVVAACLSLHDDGLINL